MWVHFHTIFHHRNIRNLHLPTIQRKVELILVYFNHSVNVYFIPLRKRTTRRNIFFFIFQEYSSAMRKRRKDALDIKRKEIIEKIRERWAINFGESQVAVIEKSDSPAAPYSIFPGLVLFFANKLKEFTKMSHQKSKEFKNLSI